MKLRILKEAGYDEAILGLSLSKGASIERARNVAVSLASKDGGHNKFLESVFVWLDIRAPRYWWQEADTYRLGTKQSESTMHTIQKQFLDQNDFEGEIPDEILAHLNSLVIQYRERRSINDLTKLKNDLPEGFLQRRIWVVDYKCLRNILLQRTTHRLTQWKVF